MHQLFSKLVLLIQIHSKLNIEQAQSEINVKHKTIITLISQLKQLGLPITINANSEIVLEQKIRPLSVELIMQNISPEIAVNLEIMPIFLTINSTNQYLKQKKIELCQKIRICLAEHQSAGRGRQSKKWVSPMAKNIYLSLHSTFKVPVKYIGGISLMVGISIIHALEILGIKNLKIKWPNDIYHNEKKLAGILIESTKIKDNETELIVGVGLNVDMNDSDAEKIDQEWVSLNKITKKSIDRNTIIAKVIECIINNKNLYEQNGLPKFMVEWRKYDYLDHKEITVKYPDGKNTSGVAEGITEYGELLVLTDHRLTKLHAGEVSIRKANK